jgi:beta-glucosidase
MHKTSNQSATGHPRKARRACLLLAPVLMLSAVPPMAGAQEASASGPALSPVGSRVIVSEARIKELLSRMTVEEKVSMLSGGSRFATAAILRLGIPALRMADGPNGIRANETWPATVFPGSVAMAATWDPAIEAQIGKSIGEEALAFNYPIVLGPGVNIQRVPIGGRNFEYYSEDPYLSGRMGVAWVKGLQGAGALAAVKHFAANNQEFERKRVNAIIPERVLREIYFPAFKAVVDEADPGLVMTSYNRLNGEHTSENKWLMRDVLKNGWGFKGPVVSDWNATHSTVKAIDAGLDLEMPAPARFFGAPMLDAVRKGEVSSATLDEAVGRLLRLAMRSGLMDGRGKGSGDVIDSPAHRAVSLAAAQEAITLLKNDGHALPLDFSKLHRIAIIGPNADARMIQGGGSSEVTPIRVVTPLQGLQDLARGKVAFSVNSGVVNDRFPPVADPRLFSTTRARTDHGVIQSYWTKGAIAGTPTKTMPDDVFMRFYFGQDLTPDPQHNLAMEWKGFFWPPRTGDYSFSMFDHGTTTVSLDDKVVVSPATAVQDPPMYDMLGWRARYATVHLEAGRPYAFHMTFLPAGQRFAAYRLGIQMPTGSIAGAVKAATGADAAVVFVGSSSTSESEESDRPNLRLFGDQEKLIEAVAKANKRTIVVLNTGGPVEMPWADKVSAIVQQWFLGGETGHAIASVLAGKANPSGKLPMTFPRHLEDNPTQGFYPGKDLEEPYGEGLLVGYRWYDTRNIAPLFPFGYGLSYTQFAYDAIDLHPAGDGWDVDFTLRNTGKMAGAEVAQLYVEMPKASGEPLRQLKRFDRVMLAPGEARRVHFHLSKADLRIWNADRKDWQLVNGTYKAWVGGSSRSLPLSAGWSL